MMHNHPSANSTRGDNLSSIWTTSPSYPFAEIGPPTASGSDVTATRGCERRCLGVRATRDNSKLLPFSPNTTSPPALLGLVAAQRNARTGGGMMNPDVGQQDPQCRGRISTIRTTYRHDIRLYFNDRESIIGLAVSTKIVGVGYYALVCRRC